MSACSLKPAPSSSVRWNTKNRTYLELHTSRKQAGDKVTPMKVGERRSQNRGRICRYHLDQGTHLRHTLRITDHTRHSSILPRSALSRSTLTRSNADSHRKK